MTRPLETVVVDNASVDGAREAIAQRFPQVRTVVLEKRCWLSENLNRGAASSSMPYVMLCNPDLLLDADAVERLASFLDTHPEAGVAAPRLVGPDGSFRASARRWYTVAALVALKGPWRDLARRLPAVRASYYHDWDMASPRAVDWAPGPAVMVRRSAFEQVGRMDERFPLYFTDVDLSLRMHEAGWGVWCVPSARVVHLERRASATPFSRAFWLHLSALLRFVGKHRGLRPRRQGR